jgi:hypothetical protein
MMKIKVVINTHRTYVRALDVLMESLSYKDHLHQIIICVSDVPTLNSTDVIQQYRERYHPDRLKSSSSSSSSLSSKVTNQNDDQSNPPSLLTVLTHPTNMYEYTSFIALAESLSTSTMSAHKGEKEGDDDDYLYLMIHDTCEAGRHFWLRLQQCWQMITQTSQPEFVGCDACLIVENGRDHRAYTLKNTMAAIVDEQLDHIIYSNNFIWAGDGRMVCLYSITNTTNTTNTNTITNTNTNTNTNQIKYAFLNKHGTALTMDPLKAFQFKKNVTDERNDDPHSSYPSCDTLNAQLRNADVWFPLTTANFNFGFATYDFLVNHVLTSPWSQTKKIDKSNSIDIELNENNPLNLRRVSGGKWRYVFQNERGQIPNISSMWRNDTDVYFDGKLRNIAYLPILDLKKFTYLIGKKWGNEELVGA